MTTTAERTKHQLDIKTFIDYKRTDILAGDSRGKELRMVTTIDAVGVISVFFEVASRIIISPGEEVSWDSFKTRLLDSAVSKYNEL